MSLPAIAFKGMLKSLAGQLIDQEQHYADCVDDDFGTLINNNAKKFFSISVIEEDLPADLAAIGVLCDDSASYLKNRGFTFFIYIDSSNKKNLTRDLKNVFTKLVLSHETCHFAFYYELFIKLGADLSSTIYTQFKNIVSGKLSDAITNEADITSQTVVEEHSYSELLKNFGNYPASHFAKNNKTDSDYNELHENFFDYLTTE